MTLFKKWLELQVQRRWIKFLQKEERRLERLQDATEQQKYVVDNLAREFLKRYPPKGD